MESRDYFTVIRERWWLVLLPVIVFTLGALFVSILLPRVYHAEVKLFVQERNARAAILGGNWVPELSQVPERAVQTQMQLMQIRPLAQLVIASLKLKTTPEDLLQQVNVAEIGQSNVITLEVTDRSAAAAAQEANAFANLYIASSRDLRQATIGAAADELDKRLAATQKTITQLSGAAASPAQAAALSAANTQYASLATQVSTLRINQKLEQGPAIVVAPAAVDPVAVSPNPARNSALGLAAGLVIGLILAFMAESIDRSSRGDSRHSAR